MAQGRQGFGRIGTMYRTIDTKFWTDPKIRKLDPSGKLMALYLVTNPHAHLGGIYYLTDQMVLSETGLPRKILDTLWHTLSGAGFAKRDTDLEVVWVVRMFEYQGKGEKNERSVANNLDSLHNSFLVNEFLQEYPSVKRFFRIGYPIGYSKNGESGTQEQEQEQEQEMEGSPKIPEQKPESETLRRIRESREAEEKRKGRK